MSQHPGAKHRHRYELLGDISLLSAEYLLSIDRWLFFHTEHRFTMTYFRTCSRSLSRNQAPLCHLPHCVISDHAENTLAPFRYSSGEGRPVRPTRHCSQPDNGPRLTHGLSLRFQACVSLYQTAAYWRSY
jgi:hypothetical protein